MGETRHAPGEMRSATTETTCARRKFLSVAELSSRSPKKFAKVAAPSLAEKSVEVRAWWFCLSTFERLAVAPACVSSPAASPLASDLGFFAGGMCSSTSV